MRSPAKFLREYVPRDYGILIVSHFSGSAAAWTHAMNTSKKEIAGDKFILNTGLRSRVDWCLVPSIERRLYAILFPALILHTLR